jgi:hypothetical protein
MTSKPTTIEQHNAKVEATLAAFAELNAKIHAFPSQERFNPTPELAVILEDLYKQSSSAWNKHKNAKARRTAFLRNA